MKTFEQIQIFLRNYLSLNNIREGTKTAFKAEHALLNGVMLVQQLPAACVVCMECGRSILTLEANN